MSRTALLRYEPVLDVLDDANKSFHQVARYANRAAAILGWLIGLTIVASLLGATAPLILLAIPQVIALIFARKAIDSCQTYLKWGAHRLRRWPFPDDPAVGDLICVYADPGPLAVTAEPLLVEVIERTGNGGVGRVALDPLAGRVAVPHGKLPFELRKNDRCRFHIEQPGIVSTYAKA